MTCQVDSVLGPKEVRLLQEVYDRAKAVKAKYPDSDLAAIAAKKLIDAFETVILPDDSLYEQWLLKAKPQGTA